jgi:predicted phosphodiesterase
MKKITGLTFFISLCFTLLAQQNNVAYRIVLLGDGGSLTKNSHPVTEAVKKQIPLDDKSTILILGDNIYKKGLPDKNAEDFKEAKAIIDAQLSIADNTNSKVYVIPGNHDWNGGKAGGWEAIKREQEYIDGYKKENVKFFPEGGCPGPVEISIGADITLLVFDSQWWLHTHEKPGEGSACASKSKEELLQQIGEIANRNKNKLLIIASHHPFRSKGPHGGFYTLKHHLFPLTDIRKWALLPMPVIGSIYPLVRAGIGTPQDLKNKNYRAMVKGIEAAVSLHPNVIFVAGHEHGLQLNTDNNRNYIVSGGACKANRVNAKKTKFGTSSTGFAVLEVSNNKSVSVKFYTVKKETNLVRTESLLSY